MVKDKVALDTMLGNYPNTAALKNGKLHSDLIDFDFAESRSRTIFSSRSCVKRNTMSASLRSRRISRPSPLTSRMYCFRPCWSAAASITPSPTTPNAGDLEPSDLTGKRVGLRAYTVTTATWVRGILADEYGVDLNKVEWITFEDPHVAEYRDPPFVKRAPAGKELVQMLLDGEIDAAVVGDKLPDPRLKHLIADHEAAAQRWAQQHGGIPINHMVVVARSCRNRGPTSSRSSSVCWWKARMRLDHPRAPSRSGSVSRRAVPCWRR